jgi:hypothetical protein
VQELRKQFPLVADATKALGIETIKVSCLLLFLFCPTAHTLDLIQ